MFFEKMMEKRLHKENKNCLIIVVGPTGSGKSLLCGGLCFSIDPEFGFAGKEAHTENVAFMKASEFLRIIRKKGMKRGRSVLFDDVGKGMKARDWYEMMNKVVSDIMQTFRVRGLFCAFNAPDTIRIDSSIRTLFHYQIELVKIDRKNKMAIAKIFEIELNKRTNKVYFKYPRIMLNGTICVIKIIKVKIPPKEWVRVYKREKRKAYMKLENEAVKIINKIEERSKRRLMDNTSTIEDVISRVKEFTTVYHNRSSINQFLIMSEYEIGLPKAMMVKRTVEKRLGM